MANIDDAIEDIHAFAELPSEVFFARKWEEIIEEIHRKNRQGILSTNSEAFIKSIINNYK